MITLSHFVVVRDASIISEQPDAISPSNLGETSQQPCLCLILLDFLAWLSSKNPSHHLIEVYAVFFFLPFGLIPSLVSAD